MRRRRRGPPTQLARAGERTRLLIGDYPLTAVRFRAQVFSGEPSGTIDVETVDGTRHHPLGPDNRLDCDGLISLSVVPERDTAITFVPVRPVAFGPGVLLGMALVLGAVGWTAWDVLGL